MVERKEAPKASESEPEELGWKDWFLKRYARYWYWLGAIFLDIIIFLEGQRSFGLHYAIALMLALLAGLAEFYVYARIWGKYGPLRVRDEDED